MDGLARSLACSAVAVPLAYETTRPTAVHNLCDLRWPVSPAGIQVETPTKTRGISKFFHS